MGLCEDVLGRIIRTSATIQNHQCRRGPICKVPPSSVGCKGLRMLQFVMLVCRESTVACINTAGMVNSVVVFVVISIDNLSA